MPVMIAPAGWLTDVDLGDPDLRLASAQIHRMRGRATDLAGRQPMGARYLGIPGPELHLGRSWFLRHLIA